MCLRLSYNVRHARGDANFPVGRQRRHVMFTGLVEALGTVVQTTAVEAGARLVLREPTLAPQLTLGESVSVNGACLTVVAHDAETFAFEAGPETLRRTNL